MNSFSLLVQSIRAYLGLSATGLDKLDAMSPRETDSFVDMVEKQNAQAYVLRGLKNAGVLSYLPEDASDALRYGAAVIAEENLLVSITFLDYMVRYIRNDNSCQPCHITILVFCQAIINN